MTETESASTSSSSEKDRMEATTEATKMLSQGKRNLVCGEVPTAVNQFQDACKLLAKAYGETAKECAEAYFYYGQALLDLARMETGVLGNALQGVPEEEEEASKSADEQFENGDKIDDEEREKLRTEVYDAMSEKEKSEGNKEESKEQKDETKDEKSEGKKDEKSEEKKDEKSEEKDEKSEKMETDEKGEAKENGTEGKEEETEGETAEEGDTAEEGETAEEEGDTAEGEDTAEEEEGKEKEDNPDDISNLQLAWEMLELAKVIYLKDENKEAKLKAADSYLKLGEVSLETEQYEQSVSDFNECLKIQKSVLEPEDRSLAETYYQLGLAYCFNKQYDESIDSYRAAIKVLEDRIAKLSKIVEGGAPEKKESEDSKEDPVKAAESEISEIKELLPDMRQKIEDSEEERKNYDQLKQMAKEAVGFGSESAPSETEQTKSDSKPASNISHLIRRKRKPEDEEADQDPKKTKQENGSGDAAVNGAKENGVMDVDKKVEGEVQPEGGAVVAS